MPAFNRGNLYEVIEVNSINDNEINSINDNEINSINDNEINSIEINSINDNEPNQSDNDDEPVEVNDNEELNEGSLDALDAYLVEAAKQLINAIKVLYVIKNAFVVGIATTNYPVTVYTVNYLDYINTSLNVIETIVNHVFPGIYIRVKYLPSASDNPVSEFFAEVECQDNCHKIIDLMNSEERENYEQRVRKQRYSKIECGR
jgi:hypothetical protein